MNRCSLKALLECLPVRTLPAVNTAHWLKCDPGQHKIMSNCTGFTQDAQFSRVKHLKNTIQDSKNEGNQPNYLETFKNGQKTQSVGRTRPTISMARDQKAVFLFC